MRYLRQKRKRVATCSLRCPCATEQRSTAHFLRQSPALRHTLTPFFDSFVQTQVSMLSRLAYNLPSRAIPIARRAISVQVAASSRARSRALTVSAVRAQSILHGSKEAKEAGDHEIQQHSRLVARGKYLHGIESASCAHEMRPSPAP
jgi:hypothetical protein